MDKNKNRPDPPPKPEPKKKQNTLIGDKIRAGTLLSSHLRRIAQEETELVDTPDGECLATKAEALARLMFKLALGYKEENIKDGTVVEKVVGPDRGMMAQIWDRIEGRAAPANENLKKKRKLPKKVSDANKDRMNKIAKNDDN